MKKVWVLVITLLGGVAGLLGLLRFLPAAWREKLSRLPSVTMGKMMENMPDE